MTIASKQDFLHDVEESVGDYLTLKQTRQVTGSIDTILQNYDLERIRNGEVSRDILNVFLEAKRVEGKSPQTIEQYSLILDRSLISIGKPVPQITTADIRAFLASEKDRGLADISVEGARSVLSSFFKWLLNEGLIRSNPVANIARIKYKKEIKKPFTNAELEKIKRECDDLRDLTIVCFLNCTGARIGEVCALDKDDIDFTAKEVKVLGKGNKERTVFIDDATLDLLKEYFDSREDKDPALFMGKRGRLTKRGVEKMLDRIEVKSGVENIHPHRFRRTLATRLIRQGMPIQDVAYILGHSNINTTLTYVCIDKANVENEYRRYM